MREKMLRKGLALLTAVSVLPALPLTKADAENIFTDSGIDYTEEAGTIQNPGAGYTTTVWAKCAPGKTEVYDPKGSFVLFFIDIGQFSSGINGEKDYDLDETFFDAWRQTFENCRNNGCLVGMRFRYDADGKDDPEPATFDKVLDHIRQIQESHILESYGDIIVLIESGFVGKWGEQHGGKYTSVEYKAQLLNALIGATGDCRIPITVRTPDTVAEWIGIKRNQLNDPDLMSRAHISSDAKDHAILTTRFGMYNDGYMGSDSDLGTFADREYETDWLNRVAVDTYYGGEFSGNIEYAKQFDTYLPENAIPEMYKTHLSYINGNIFPLYKDMEYTEKYAVEGADNSAYYGESVFQFIRDHIGYRFILRDSKLTSDIKQGDTLKLRFSVENTGFANPIFHPGSYIILEKDGVYICAPLNIDCHDWRSCEITENSLDLHIPDNIEPGKWNVYFKANGGYGNVRPQKMSLCSIRFANKDIWNSSLGANYLGSVNISKSDTHGTDNKLRPADDPESLNCSYQYFYSDVTPVIDGDKTFDDEWTEDMKLTENEKGQSVYVRNDEKYLYVMSKMPTGAKAPVYNIQLKNPHNNENYWMYYESGGFIYFNHEPRGNSGCKWKDDTVEFRLPLENFDLEPNDVIGSLRVFLQDSGNDWKLMGDVTAKDVKVEPYITVYNAECDIVAKKGDYYVYRVYTADTPAETGMKYQWLKDGEPIENSTSLDLSIYSVGANAKGSYSVKLTAPNGAEKIVPIVNIKVEGADTSAVRKDIAGDANCDGDVDLADAVLIMQVIANPDKFGKDGIDKGRITAEGEKNADVSGYKGENDGLTAKDALAIQKYMLKIITELPEKT